MLVRLSVGVGRREIQLIDLSFLVLLEEIKEEPGRCIGHKLHTPSSHFNACNKGGIS
jgi:hypothetical protein